MLSYEDRPSVEVETTIDGPRSAVWEHVTDINLSARFQDEFRGAEWVDDGPALEARFRGRNAIQDREWETTSWVTVYEPEAAFGWVVADRDNPGAEWVFRLTDDGGRTKLTYTRWLGPGPSGLTAAIEKYPEREHEIIERRNEAQRQSMQAVVDGVKTLVEG